MSPRERAAADLPLCPALMGYHPHVPAPSPILGLVRYHAPERPPRMVRELPTESSRGPLGPRQGSKCWRLWQEFKGRTVSRKQVAAFAIDVLDIDPNLITAYLRDLVACGKATKLQGGTSWRVEP